MSSKPSGGGLRLLAVRIAGILTDRYLLCSARIEACDEVLSCEVRRVSFLSARKCPTAKARELNQPCARASRPITSVEAHIISSRSLSNIINKSTQWQKLTTDATIIVEAVVVVEVEATTSGRGFRVSNPYTTNAYSV